MTENMQSPMLDRIKKLQWSHSPSNDSRLASSIKLMQEYLRRMLLWSEALDVKMWPFFSVAEQIITLPVDVDFINEQISNVKFLHGVHLLMKLTCIGAIQWDYVKESTSVKQFNLPDPYEPLIVFYERGASFFREQDMIDLAEWTGKSNIIGLSRKTFKTLIPFVVDLTWDALDRIDKGEDVTTSDKNDPEAK